MRTRTWLVLIALAMLAPVAGAQRKEPTTSPVEPMKPLGAAESSSKEETPAPTAPVQTPAAEKQPLTGVQAYTLGATSRTRNLLLPRLSISQIGDSNSTVGLNQREFATATVVSGGLTLQRIWRRYQFAMGYSGGGALYPTNSALNEQFHSFGMAQSISLRRWNLLFADQFGYAPESNFIGAGQFDWLAQTGMGFPGTLAAPQSGLSPNVQPNQTVITGRANRFSNTAAVQAQYLASRRTSMTFSASHGLLMFREAGFVDSSAMALRGGLDHDLTARDSVGVAYQAQRFRFDSTNSVNNFDVHTVDLVYGRRLTGRLAWRISGGPQFIRPRATGTANKLTYSAGTNLTYQMRMSAIGLYASHGVAGGAGVFAGGKVTSAGVTFDHRFSRHWSAGFNAGYAHNEPLETTVLNPTAATFNTYLFGTQVTRQLGRYSRLFFSYNLERQTGTAGVGNVPYRHRFGIGINFGFQPVEIE